MEHYDWNDGWLFTPVFDPAIVRPECPELTLEPVRLPHTVKALPYNYCNENDYQKLSGYRREFFAPKEWEGRTVLLTFGAVAHDATVFCNGRRVFHHSCGYTAFTVDLTSALHLGQKNVVAVRCDSREDLNIPPFGGQMDFLTYGGICRAVCLDVKEPAYLRDIFIETKAEGDFRIYTATVGETVGCTLQAEIRSPSGSRAFYTGELSLPITGALNSVHPWSIEHPTLYTLTVRLIRPGTGGLPDRVLDEKSCRFGFRTLQFVAGGLYLNGQRVELRGLNRRQSYAYQGYAMPDSIQRLDAQLLKKQLGCNAVRLTTPPSPAFLDACDELAAATPASFCGACGSAAAPTTRAFINAPTRRCAASTPPAPRLVPAAPAAASFWKMFTPMPTTPTTGAASGARPAPPSPPTPGKAISSASSRAPSSRPSPSTTSPTAWRRPCATPPSSTTPSLSRAWRAASAGA